MSRMKINESTPVIFSLFNLFLVPSDLLLPHTEDSIHLFLVIRTFLDKNILGSWCKAAAGKIPLPNSELTLKWISLNFSVWKMTSKYFLIPQLNYWCNILTTALIMWKHLRLLILCINACRTCLTPDFLVSTGLPTYTCICGPETLATGFHRLNVEIGFHLIF